VERIAKFFRERIRRRVGIDGLYLVLVFFFDGIDRGVRGGIHRRLAARAREQHHERETSHRKDTSTLHEWIATLSRLDRRAVGANVRSQSIAHFRRARLQSRTSVEIPTWRGACERARMRFLLIVLSGCTSASGSLGGGQSWNGESPKNQGNPWENHTGGAGDSGPGPPPPNPPPPPVPNGMQCDIMGHTRTCQLAAACPTMVQLQCTTQQVRACTASTDCMEMSYANCCTFSFSMKNATFCVGDIAKVYAVTCN